MRYIDNNKKEKKTLRQLDPELRLQFCYPRLDVNVSKGINHLLKSPFCVHPKTGQVCVPFDPKHVESFCMKDVPNITQLLGEINEYDKANVMQVDENDDKDKTGKSARKKEWWKTSMKPYMKIFQKFLEKLPKAEQELF